MQVATHERDEKIKRALVKYRTSQGLSQNAFARTIGIDRGLLSRMMSGKEPITNTVLQYIGKQKKKIWIYESLDCKNKQIWTPELEDKIKRALVKYRTSQGLSQNAFADKIGITHGLLSQMMTGKEPITNTVLQYIGKQKRKIWVYEDLK